ncbi:MAG: OprD family outer membrane porin [Sulfurospirillaceae bacterium]|nr:OprD family outer membrane porin [Sulfurospirillaceae bacterium]
MKLSKLVLVAIITAGTIYSSAKAADNLEDSFKKGTLSGTLKSFYRDVSVYNAVDKTGFAVGGDLGYVTDTFYGFGAGVTFQTSHTLGLKDNNLAEVDTDVAISQTLLSEAYLSYKCDKTKSLIKIGRQYIDTPLINTNTIRLINDSAEAITLTNTYFANTTIFAGAVDKWYDRSGTETDHENHIYTAYATNSSIKGLGLTGQITTQSDSDTLVYLDVAYTLPITFPLTIGAQYYGTYFDSSANKEDTALYGVMVGTKVAGIGLSAYYNKTDKDNDVNVGYGQGTDWTYNAVEWWTGYWAGTESYQGKVSYDFSQVGIKGLSAFTRYVVYDNSVNPANDAKEWDIDVKYVFAGSLKGLDARVRYSDTKFDTATANDGHDLRLIVNYKF